MHLSLQLDLRDCVTWSRGYLRQQSLSPGPLTASQASILNSLYGFFCSLVQLISLKSLSFYRQIENRKVISPLFRAFRVKTLAGLAASRWLIKWGRTEASGLSLLGSLTLLSVGHGPMGHHKGQL